MKRREKRTPCGYAGLVLLLAVGTFDQVYGQSRDAAPFNVDLARCIDLRSDDERFACYQERVDEALAKRGSSTQTTADAANAGSVGAAPVSPTERAGESEQQPGGSAGVVPEQRTTASSAVPASSTAAAAAADEILATITQLRETVPDLWIITLDNGQIWQMTRAQGYPLRIGLEVRLKSTRWGDSYRLTAPEHGGFVPVRRAL